MNNDAQLEKTKEIKKIREEKRKRKSKGQLYIEKLTVEHNAMKKKNPSSLLIAKFCLLLFFYMYKTFVILFLSPFSYQDLLKTQLKFNPTKKQFGQLCGRGGLQKKKGGKEAGENKK